MSGSENQRAGHAQTQAIEGFSVSGLSIITANDRNQATDDINRLWQDFMEQDCLHRLEERVDNVVYAVYSDYQGDETKPFRVTLGCKMRERSADPALHSVDVPPADYVIFAARGEQPKALLQVWETVWKSDLPRTFHVDLEIYGPRFFETGLHEILVCVGVKT